MEKTGWNATLKPDTSESGSKVKIVSLDDFLAGQSKVAQYKLVKIDTEGFDCAIIRGAKQFIRQVQPVITFEYNRDNMAAIGEKGLDTLRLLEELGYSRIIFHDAGGRYLCSTTLADRELIRDLHGFADGKRGAIFYYDLTVFPQGESDLAAEFVEPERLAHHHSDGANKPTVPKGNQNR